MSSHNANLHLNVVNRYKQRLQIHKLKDDIIEIKRIIVVPRLYSKYVEESKNYHRKKQKGEYVSSKEYDMYELNSNKSTPLCKNRSMAMKLNGKSRYSQPLNANEITELHTPEENLEEGVSAKLDFIPGELFNQKSNTERHQELVTELKGSRNKPSILNHYKSVASLAKMELMSK